MNTVHPSLVEKERRQKRNNRITTNVFFSLIMILLLIIVMNAFVYMTIEVEGLSMWPTLNNGDVLKVNKRISASHGDIVIIQKYSKEDKCYILVIKRVIAMGGDKVEIKDGKVYVNDKLLDEPYVPDEINTNMPDGSDYSYTLKDDEVFYLGDNRINSEDSRGSGCCKEEDVLGVLEDWAYNMRGFFGFVHNLF